MQIRYLEFVSNDADGTCALLEKLHGVRFGSPEPGLGGARTAESGSGTTYGVRAPMHESEEPVVRPYVLVDDIASAVEEARAAGGEIAHPPLEIPGRGTFAIYFRGGLQFGLWQD